MGSNTLVEADIWTVAQTEQGNVVLVRPKFSNVAVPIFIGQLETQAILIGLGKVEMPRPLTHDLFLSVLTGLGAVLTRIEVYDLQEGTYFARLIVDSAAGVLEFDARPSDAMALAVRSKAGVFISEDIVEEAGVPVDMIREAPKSPADGVSDKPVAPENITEVDTASWNHVEDSERERLKLELDQAIAQENYELAALIRDKLTRL